MCRKRKSEQYTCAGGYSEKTDAPGVKRCGKWGKAFTAAAGALTVCSLLTCAPMIYPAFVFIFLFIIPVVCTLGLIFVIDKGYWNWVSGILSGGMDAAAVISDIWIWPEIAGALFCAAAIVLFARDKTAKHTAGIAVCVIFALACVLFAFLRLSGG